MEVRSLLRKVSVVGVSAACCLAMVGCSGSNYGYTGGVAATVNGVDIQEDEITKYIQDARTSAQIDSDDAWGSWLAQVGIDPQTLRSQIVDYYVDKELVNQACNDFGITIDNDAIQQQIDAMKSNYGSDEEWKKALETNGTTEDEYRKLLEESMKTDKLQEAVVNAEVSDEEILNDLNTNMLESFKGSKRSSHILFQAGDEATAQDVLNKINSGQISFEDAAKQYSTDTGSASKGGDVGWDCTSSFVSAYTEGLKSLALGQVSGLVTSDYGIHIIKCTDEWNPTNTPTSLSDYPEEFIQYDREILLSDKQYTAYQEWFENYKNQAEITINDMPENVPYNIDLTKYNTSANSADITTGDTSSDDESVSVEQNSGNE